MAAMSRRLIRTRIGPFTLEQAVESRSLSTDSIDRHIRSALDAIPDLPRVTLDRVQVEAVVQGRRLWVRDLGDQAVPEGQVAMLDPVGNLVALAEQNPREGGRQPPESLDLRNRAEVASPIEPLDRERTARSAATKPYSSSPLGTCSNSRPSNARTQRTKPPRRPR